MSLTLSDEAKRQLIEARLAAFAVDAYGHELNRQVAVENDDEEARLLSEEAIASIEAATLIYETELQGLVVEEPIVEEQL